jgi:hypothetical protein
MKQSQLDAYLEHIRNDYGRWSGVAKLSSDDSVKVRMNQEFRDGVHYEMGSKYIKVIIRSGMQRSVHSFICLNDTGKFKQGDILKAAGWKAPARNFARGNVIAGEFGNVRWMGA